VCDRHTPHQDDYAFSSFTRLIIEGAVIATVIRICDICMP
jgi:hypothetical protein